MLETLIAPSLFVAMVTYLVIDSVIFDGPRHWYGRFYMTSCPFCTGMWAAFLAAIVVWPPSVLYVGAYWWIGVFAYFAMNMLAAKSSEV